MIFLSKSEEKTQKFGFDIGKNLKKRVQRSSRKPFLRTTDQMDDSLRVESVVPPLSYIICLYGDLGSGKTTFVRGIAKAFGIRSKIQSPTFTYQRIHSGKIKLYHFDCYRITRPDSMLLNEFIEALENNDGVIVIEWSENIKFLTNFFPKNRMNITFEHIDERTRKIQIRENTSYDRSSSF